MGTLIIATVAFSVQQQQRLSVIVSLRGALLIVTAADVERVSRDVQPGNLCGQSKCSAPVYITFFMICHERFMQIILVSQALLSLLPKREESNPDHSAYTFD